MANTEKKKVISELLSSLPGMLYRCYYDSEWTMLFVSEGCEFLTGYSKVELLNNRETSYADLIHRDDRDLIYRAVEKALSQRLPFSYEYRIYPKYGSCKWVWEQGVGIYNTSGEVKYIEGFITDITSQKKEQEKLKRDLNLKDRELLINLSLLNEYKKAVDASAIATKTDLEGIITYVNEEFCRVSGLAKDEVIGRSHNMTRDPQTPTSFFKEMWNTILDKRIWKGVISNVGKGGHRYYVKSTIVPILDCDGNIHEFMLIGYDVTDLILQEKKIKFQTTDFLTQCANRQKLLEDLQGSDLKLAIINLERFKEVNEYYGFATGDCVLIELSKMMAGLIQELNMKLYKLHGDEFAILTDISIDKETFRAFVVDLLQKIKGYRFNIDGHQFTMSAIAGVSMQKNFFINAEIAIQHAKESKKDVVFFDDNTDLKKRMDSNISWTNRIKAAIEEERIDVFVQPIMCQRSKEIFKFECLVRLIDIDGTVISPLHFLATSKKARLYSDITRAVINKSFDCFKDRSESFSINLSVEDILNADTVEFLKTKIQQYPGIGQRLILEIVEDEGIENYFEVSRFIENMKFLGCCIAIDDFGTGYSNFDYLMRLNIDFIKIDGSIIKNIDHDDNARIVTELIINFGKKLNIKTIAEYVHSETVLNVTHAMGIDYAQGYFVGQPYSIDHLKI